MVILVTGEGQPVTLDRIGDEAGRLVVAHRMKGIENRLQVVTGKIGHQPMQSRIVAAVENGADTGVAVEIAVKMLAPAFSTCVDQRRVERIGAGVYPFAQ